MNAAAIGGGRRVPMAITPMASKSLGDKELSALDEEEEEGAVIPESPQGKHITGEPCDDNMDDVVTNISADSGSVDTSADVPGAPAATEAGPLANAVSEFKSPPKPPASPPKITDLDERVVTEAKSPTEAAASSLPPDESKETILTAPEVADILPVTSLSTIAVDAESTSRGQISPASTLAESLPSESGTLHESKAGNDASSGIDTAMVDDDVQDVRLEDMPVGAAAPIIAEADITAEQATSTVKNDDTKRIDGGVAALDDKLNAPVPETVRSSTSAIEGKLAEVNEVEPRIVQGASDADVSQAEIVIGGRQEPISGLDGSAATSTELKRESSSSRVPTPSKATVSSGNAASHSTTEVGIRGPPTDAVEHSSPKTDDGKAAYAGRIQQHRDSFSEGVTRVGSPLKTNPKNSPSTRSVSESISSASSPFAERVAERERIRRNSLTDERSWRSDAHHHRSSDRSDVKRGGDLSFLQPTSTTPSRSLAAGPVRDTRHLTRHSSVSAMPATAKERLEAEGRYRAFDNRTNSPQPRESGRPALERHTSFSSGRLERSSPVLSRARSSNSPMNQHGFPDVKRMRRQDGSSPEPSALKDLRANSTPDVLGRGNVSTAVGSPRVESKSTGGRARPGMSDIREELPALPEIPLPEADVLAAVLNEAAADVTSDSTPTKISKRPRLGWGQGLVASSPPQPPKRPRIGWGEGLVQQASATDSKSPVTTGAPSVAPDGTQSGDAQNTPTGASTAAEEKIPTEASVSVPEATTTPDVGAINENEASTTADVVIAANETGDSATVDENAKEVSTVEQTPIPQDDIVMTDASKDGAQESPVKPSLDVAMPSPEKTVNIVPADMQMTPSSPPLSKEDILASIDTLDSNILELNKQIKMLEEKSQQKDIEQTTSAVLDDKDTSASVSVPEPKATTDVPEERIKVDAVDISTPTKTELRAPTKISVDATFVELVTGIFSENMKRAAVANAKVPKRLENGVIATKLYHQPSDYSFYQRNIDRGAALSDAIRIKVRNRNRRRHEHVKMLAREYIDMKKAWKLRVKKLEKDRKRQEKMRNKLKMKQAQKNSTSPDSSTHFSTLHTTHQSPHVQQIHAASSTGGTNAGGGSNEGGSSFYGPSGVRSSSRLTNNSSGDVQSKQDLEKIEQAKAQALLDQEVRKKRLKNAMTTVIPDMLMTEDERRARYFTRFVNGQSSMSNGLVKDWKKREQTQVLVNPWNDLEKCIFMDKFLQFPKNFARISFALGNKTTGDVISFYYRTKKVVDYKALLREQQLRRRGAGAKNTWCCWNLSACAAICLGVKFPKLIAKLLLHPSNFRSHQASDNILNSPGAQSLLQDDASNGSSTVTSVKEEQHRPSSAMEIIAQTGRDEQRASQSPSKAKKESDGVILDAVIQSASADSSDTAKFDLYTQQLIEFVAGQQQPFLLKYGDYFTDNSFSTGFEVSTLSVAERLKQYNLPVADSSGNVASKRISVSSAVANSTANALPSAAVSDEVPSSGKGKHGNHGKGDGSKHMTKKEQKQQRKLKKMQDAAAAVATPQASSGKIDQSSALAASNSAQSSVTSSQGRNRKGGANASAASSGGGGNNRASPRVGEDKPPSHGGKKSKGSGGNTPSARRSSASASQAAGAAVSLTIEVPPSQVSALNVHQNEGDFKVEADTVTAEATTSSATAGSGGGGGVTPGPTKRVVQKWTDAEKSDFLKFFSVRFSFLGVFCLSW